MYNIVSFEQKVNLLTEDKLKILEFNGVKFPVTFECLKCHNITTVKKGEVLVRKGKTFQCPHCHNSKERVTKENYQKIIKAAKEHKIEVLEYSNTGTVAKFKCLKCEQEFTREPLRFLKNQRCPYCESRCLSIPLEMFKKELSALSEYEIVDEHQYKNLHEKILIRHECGFIWKVVPSKLLAESTHCPKCSKRVSKGEKKIQAWLEENKIAFIPQWSQNIEGHVLFFDLYVPKWNTAIEFQGEQHFKPVDYFGGEDGFKIRRLYDNYKKEWCKNNNINLLEISWYDYERIEEILEAQRLTQLQVK